jgi:replicative DNA helicase
MSFNDKKKTVPHNMMYGKMAPQAPELEVVILGAMLIEPKCLQIVFELIKEPEVFYLDAHQRIYASIRRLFNDSKPVDFQTVCDELRKVSELEMVGGSYYVVSLARDVVSSAHIEMHIRIVLEKYFKRELIRIGGMVVGDSYDDTIDLFDTLEKLRGTVTDINEKIELTSQKEFSQILNGFVENLNKDISEKESGAEEIKMYIPEYDKVLGNLQGGNVYVLAARTSMGKSGFEIAVTLKQSEHFPIGIWNGELTEKRMIRRYISNKIGVTVIELADNPGKYADEILKGIEDLLQHKIQMDNTRSINIDILCNKIKYWVFSKGCKCIWLDYVQVIKLSEKLMKILGTKTEQVGYVIDRINEVAAICDVPIILLAQVNREALKNGDKKPTLGNLRDSGSIEERVYHVAFLHRPEYYGEQEYEGKSTENMMQIIVAKNGDGINPATIEIKHELKFNRVMSMMEYTHTFAKIETSELF